MPEESERIAIRLYEAARQRANARGFQLDASASEAIRDKANEAAGEVVDRARTDRGPLEPHITIGETSFRRLVDEMIAAAGGQRQLTNQQFQAALLSICPIWPICR